MYQKSHLAVLVLDVRARTCVHVEFKLRLRLLLSHVPTSAMNHGISSAFTQTVWIMAEEQCYLISAEQSITHTGSHTGLRRSPVLA